MKYYVKQSYEAYELYHSKWLARKPKDPFESTEYDNGNPEHARLLSHWLISLKRWERSEPQIEWVQVGPSGSYCIEACVGFAPTNLLLHQRFTTRFPYVPLRQVLERAKRKHELWEGLDMHRVRISVYEADSLRNLQSLEVNLWQDVPDVEALVEPALAVLRTPALQPRVFRF